MIRIIGVDSLATSEREFSCDDSLLFYCAFRKFRVRKIFSYRPPDDSISTILDITFYEDSGIVYQMNAVIMSLKSRNPIYIPYRHRLGAPIAALNNEKITKFHSDVSVFFGDDFIDVDLGHNKVANECIVDGNNYFVTSIDGNLLGIRIAALPPEQVRACENRLGFSSQRPGV